MTSDGAGLHMPIGRLELIGLSGIPLVATGDDLADFVTDALARAGMTLRDGDVLVVAQKIVSKAEGRLIMLSAVRPGDEARRLAAATGKDARVVELILQESRRIVRHRPNLIIAEHRLGFVMANAGVDQSNIEGEGEHEAALLLPRDPDASARDLRERLAARHGGLDPFGVVVSDSFGRAWRRGTVGVALGSAGLPALVDLRGTPDLFGRPLKVTMVGFADEIASAASLLMGQADEAQPAVLVRGLGWPGPEASAQALVRPADEDLFR